MHDRERFDHDDRLKALDLRLRTWQPAPGGLDRDRMLFEAGQAASHRASRGAWRPFAWPTAAALAACLTLAMGLAWRAERSRREVLEVLLAQQVSSPEARPRQDPPLLAHVETSPLPELRPSSYLSLIRRLDADSSDVDRVRPVSRPIEDSPDLVEARPRPEQPPLRPRDFDRLIPL